VSRVITHACFVRSSTISNRFLSGNLSSSVWIIRKHYFLSNLKPSAQLFTIAGAALCVPEYSIWNPVLHETTLLKTKCDILNHVTWTSTRSSFKSSLVAFFSHWIPYYCKCLINSMSLKGFMSTAMQWGHVVGEPMHVLLPRKYQLLERL